MKRLLSLFLLMYVSLSAMAHDMSALNADNVRIWYNIYKRTKTAAVTYRGSSYNSYINEYTGDVVIPSTVMYDGEEYSVTSIEGNAFYNCDSITSITIPKSVTSIGNNAFYGCSGLTSITLPESVKSIGDYAFKSCSALKSITINVTSLTGEISLKEIGKDAFAYCSALTDVYYNGKITGWCNITFESSASNPLGYSEHFYIDSVEVKDYLNIWTGVSEIKDYAFYNFDALTSVTIPWTVDIIGDYAFYDCDSLTSVTIEKGDLTTIRDYAFSDCSALKKIIIPEGVTTIRDYAFNKCYALTSITLPKSLTSIGKHAFGFCSALTDVYYNGTTADWCGILFNINYSNPLYYARRLYIDGEEVTNLVIPSGVTAINSYAFYDCEALTSITLPEGLTSIGEYAFYNCYKLDEVYNKSDLTITAGSKDNGYVAYYAKNVYTDSEGESKLKTVGDYLFFVDGEDIDLIAYTGSETSITLPSDYEGKNYNIGDYAFGSCSALTSITLPEGLTSIGYDAFAYCSSLTSITIPEGVTSIGDEAFEDCSSLTSITIPEGVTSIGYAAFEDCDALTSITIPEGVTSIGHDVFAYCSSLTSITLPEGLTSIGYDAFAYCSSLTSITFPEGVTSIGNSAFYDCDALTSITSKNATPPTIGGSYTFYDVDKSIPVYVPKSSVDAYKSAEYWKDFTNIVGVYYVDVIAENGTVDGTGVYKENDEATLTVTPNEGYKFVKWSDGKTDNPRTIVVVSDTTFTAEFEIKEYTLTIDAENGTVEGAGTYKHGDEVTLTATPNEGNKFVKWSDGVTDNPRTIVVVLDTTFTAEFELKEYTLTTEAENGTVEGAGTYKHGDKVTLTATPIVGYIFAKWSDGVTDNPRTVVVVSDTTFTAVFELKEYTLTTEAENGTVEGAGTYKHGAEATLTATPIVGYKFVKWSDGVTDNPRIVVVVSDTTLTAVFELKEYTLTTEAENGTVEGAGTYKHGDEATLTATPNEGYKFVKWSDGVTVNLRTVVVVSDTTFTAVFELKEYTVAVTAKNGTVEGVGTYKHGAEATLIVTPIEGYKFVKWSDGVTDNSRTIEVTSDLTLTAEIYKLCSVYATTENGFISGAGEYVDGDEVTLTATPFDGYEFFMWRDKYGNAVSFDANYTFTVTSDVELTAVFKEDDNPISDIQTSDVNVRLIGSSIVVDGADDYTVYSINGQNLGKVERVERGIYIVVVNGKSYKVIAK